MESTPTQNQSHLGRILLWIGAVILIGVLAYFGTRNTALFRADITQPEEDPRSDTAMIYIPENYIGSSPDAGQQIEAKVGGEGIVDGNGDFINFYSIFANIRFQEPVSGVSPTIAYDPNNFLDLNGTVWDDPSVNLVTNVQPDADPNLVFFGIDADAVNPVSASDGQTLFKINVNIEDGLNPGDLINLTVESFTLLGFDGNGDAIELNESVFADGQITINCDDIFCGNHGVCNNDTGQCACNQGYAIDSEGKCNSCAPGFLGFPNCTINIFQDLEAIVLSIGDAGVSQLSQADRDLAFHTAYLMLNSANAAGNAITVEGQNVNIPSDSSCDAPVSDLGLCLTTISSQLAATIGNLNNGTDGQNLIAVETVPSISDPAVPVPGLLKLTATSFNENNAVDVTSAIGSVKVAPGLDLGLNLATNASIPAELIGKNNDGGLQPLTFLNVAWFPQPFNRLNNEALNGGLFEPGDVAGSGPVFAQLSKADGTPVNSNTVIITTPRGPVIEDLQRIGVGPITQGTVVNLRAKVSDVDTIANISDITIFLQSADGAQTFDAAEFNVPVAQIDETESGTEGSGETAEFFKIYEFPYQILGDLSQFDGAYQLLVEITDADGNVATGTVPITIGQLETGDVNGDGQLNNIDVALLFRLIDERGSGCDLPLPLAQQEAADLNNDGCINEQDTQLLFQQLAQQ